MTTKAYATMKALCDGIEDIYSTAVCSGIIGDLRHRKKGQGSYHMSRQDNPPHTYSVIRSLDRAGNGPADASAGFDISMSKADMIRATRRLATTFDNTSDPRRKYLNAFNGWLGSGDAKRYDIVARQIKYATPDHKWHLHGEVRRYWVNSKVMVNAILSALRGETVTVYLRSIGVQPDPPKKPVATPRYPGRVLKPGGKPDPALIVWQTRMRARGWTSIGKPDGVFGPKTTTVVRRYQKVCKVGVDGTIGPATWPLPWRPLG